jgi:hypothetical protein
MLLGETSSVDTVALAVRRALSQTVHAVAPVHLAEIAEGHVIHDALNQPEPEERSAVATDAFT